MAKVSKSRKRVSGKGPARAKTAPKRKLRASSRPAKGQTAAIEKKLRQFAIAAARLIDDLHGSDILLLDVRGSSDVTDYLLIASGTSDRQIRSVAQSVRDLGREQNITARGIEADTAAAWVVIDFADVVVHLFEPAARAHYDLEMMWGDAKRLVWRRR